MPKVRPLLTRCKYSISNAGISLSDFCRAQAVNDEDEDKQLWWLKQSNYWDEKNERLSRELDEVMEDITEPPPPDR
jgi:hypothetical protein